MTKNIIEYFYDLLLKEPLPENGEVLNKEGNLPKNGVGKRVSQSSGRIWSYYDERLDLQPKGFFDKILLRR